MKALELRGFLGNTMADILKYLRVDVSKAFRDLFVGLQHMAFSENFDHFYEDVDIPAGETLQIPNRLKRADVIWWPVRITGDARLIDGATASTREFLYIMNASATDATATLFFTRK
jgi:hypothetical protein